MKITFTDIWDMSEPFRWFLVCLLVWSPFFIAPLLSEPVSDNSAGNGQDSVEYLEGTVGVVAVEEIEDQARASQKQEKSGEVTYESSDTASL